MSGRPAGRPVFVGGCPRSGTTLLRTMLNSHPDLAVPHETLFLVPAWRRRDAFGDLGTAEARVAVARWLLDLKKSRFHRLGIEAEELVERFAAAPPTLGSLMEACFALYAEHNGKERWGDKRPSYARNLDAVFGLFPDTQFVNVVRDPRACVLSMRKAWPSWGLLASATEVWERTDADVQRAIKRLRADQILEIKYEDLINRPDETLHLLCEFYGLDTGGIGRMMDYHRGSKLPTGELYENAARPVNTASLQKWAKELEPAEIALIERTLGKRMRHYGYEPSDPQAAPDADDLAELDRLRRERDKEFRVRQLVELKRKVTYRRPVAAALSTV